MTDQFGKGQQQMERAGAGEKSNQKRSPWPCISIKESPLSTSLGLKWMVTEYESQMASTGR